MKSFILGVLITLVCGLGVQNHILTKELNNHLRESHRQAPKSSSKIKQARIKVKRQKPVQAEQVIVVSEEQKVQTYLANKGYNNPNPQDVADTKSYDPRDPRCPSIAPYYNERWGCIVIPR